LARRRASPGQSTPRADRGRRTGGRKHHAPVQISDASHHVAATSAVLASRGVDQLDERAPLRFTLVSEHMMGYAAQCTSSVLPTSSISRCALSATAATCLTICGHGSAQRLLRLLAATAPNPLFLVFRRAQGHIWLRLGLTKAGQASGKKVFQPFQLSQRYVGVQ
jgi:hypothetical protein